MKQEENSLPTWVKRFFLGYAIFWFLYSILFAITWIGSFFNQNIYTSSEIIPYSGVWIPIVVLLLIILFLDVVFIYGVITLKRWVLPIITFFALSSLLVGIADVVRQNFASFFQLLFLLCIIVFSGVIFYASIKYWSLFTGSTRKLYIQIPLIFLTLPITLFALLNSIVIDYEMISDSDLIVPSIDRLPESENAHYFLPHSDDISIHKQDDIKKSSELYRVGIDQIKETGSMDVYEEIFNLVYRTLNVTDKVINASTKKGTSVQL